VSEKIDKFRRLVNVA